MKLVLFNLVVLIFLCASCSKKDNEVHLSETIIFEGELFQLESNDPYSGIVYNTYLNGKREYEGKYINGRPNGSLIYWYQSGNKMRHGELKDGIPIGRWNYYNEDGSLNKYIDY